MVRKCSSSRSAGAEAMVSSARTRSERCGAAGAYKDMGTIANMAHRQFGRGDPVRKRFECGVRVGGFERRWTWWVLRIINQFAVGGNINTGGCVWI